MCWASLDGPTPQVKVRPACYKVSKHWDVPIKKKMPFIEYLRLNVGDVYLIKSPIDQFQKILNLQGSTTIASLPV